MTTSDSKDDPEDLFEPRMPEVEGMFDVKALFAKAREEKPNGVFIFTPGRMRMEVNGPAPGSMPPEAERQARAVLGGDRPFHVVAVAYNKLEALLQDKENNARSMDRCIPFLGMLVSLAYVGHSVLIFEGHPLAFEAGVRGADVLIIDEAMLPFLQEDWAKVAFGAMRPRARIFVHDRQHYSLQPVGRSAKEPGWQYTEHDGEASYLNCLLTSMGKVPKRTVRITEGEPLPDLAQIATDPDELDWIASLPFRYDRLDAALVMEILDRVAKKQLFSRTRYLTATLHLSKSEQSAVSFQITDGRSDDGKRQVDIELR
ncbi:MAG TPA: hypothetical protein VIG99_07520 [Myxococcaceae bacterium]|jgi:hypothetical protein